MVRLPSSVLYVCSLNRVRSPMAAALTRRIYGRALRVESSGLEPSDEVDALAAVVMQEVGVDLFAHEPRGLEAFDPGAFELIVALSPEARDHLQDVVASHAQLEFWPVHDPTAEEGSREQRLEAYRQTRRELEARITGRFGPPAEWE